MGHLSHFQTRDIVGVRLAGATVNKTAILFCVSRAAVSKDMVAWEDFIS